MGSAANSPPNASSRKAYVTPSLQIYGSIGEITQANPVTSATGDNLPAKRNLRTGG
jgi:hypothetical protein